MIFVIAIRPGNPTFPFCEAWEPTFIAGYSSNETYVRALVEDYSHWLEKAVKIKNDIFDNHSWTTINSLLELQAKTLLDTLPSPFPLDVRFCSNKGSVASYHGIPELP